MLTYRLFDPTPCGFPAPRVPLLPMFERCAWGSAHASEFALVGALRSSRAYKRGRYALFDAYRLCGVGPSGALLAPAYHCRTMLDPAISLGGELLLYEMEANLAPRIESLHRLVSHAQHPVRAMLLTHYFGFPQHVAPLKAFCDEHGIALIEDCSHALFNLRGKERLGQHGRYTIASPYKLLPCEEGGLLIPGAGASLPEAPSRWPGVRAELGVLVASLQRWLAHRSVASLAADAAALDATLAGLGEVPSACAAESIAAIAGTSHMYLDREEGQAGPAAARWLVRLCDLDHAVKQRRQRYRQWCTAVQALPHCRPLIPVLPEDCAPYMFPLLIDHPDPHFYALKRLGMPIWRWDEMAVSDCGVANHYRQHLLHLPCHQALSDAEVAWMHDVVSKVMRRLPAGVSTYEPGRLSSHFGGPTWCMTEADAGGCAQ